MFYLVQFDLVPFGGNEQEQDKRIIDGNFKLSI